MEITLCFLGIGALLLGILLGKKDNEIRRLEREKDDLKYENECLKNGINLATKVIGTSNVMNVPPKDLPEDFDKE